jgi:hypothetical protein
VHIFELIDESGEIIAQFDLAWPEYKIAMVLEPEDKVENCDWKQFVKADLSELINEIKSGVEQ